MNSKVNLDYVTVDNTLIINSINVKKKFRRKGLGSSVLKELEVIAKNKNCYILFTPSDLSRMALSFWLKNGFNPVVKRNTKKITFVLNSNKSDDFIFDIDSNSVIEMTKKIRK